jgi:hypothetical protein
MHRIVFAMIFSLGMMLLPYGDGRASDMEWRCGSRIASVGMRMGEVRGLCGEPTSSRSWQEYGPSGSSVNMEEWTYNMGAERFMQFLRFKNGILDTMESGGYGY